MAGPAGFEPAHDGTKNRCLTAWLWPNSYKNSIYHLIEFIHIYILFHKNKLNIRISAAYDHFRNKMVEGVGLEPTNPMGADLQSAAFGQLRYPSTLKITVVPARGLEPPTY